VLLFGIVMPNFKIENNIVESNKDSIQVFEKSSASSLDHISILDNENFLYIPYESQEKYWKEFYSFVPSKCIDFGKKRKILRSEQRKNKKIIRAVAKEMGADSRLLLVWAKRESNYREYIRHKKKADLEASTKSWTKFKPLSEEYQRGLADRYKKANNKKRKQKLRYEIYRRNVYKNNPFFFERNRWSTGLGLYGMNPIYHTKKWDNDAPPEILCDPFISTIVAIWTARHVLKTCTSRGYEPNITLVNRGFSRGNCEAYGADKYFNIRARRNGLDPSKPPRLGNKWNSKTSNRRDLLSHMIKIVYEDTE